MIERKKKRKILFIDHVCNTPCNPLATTLGGIVYIQAYKPLLLKLSELVTIMVKLHSASCGTTNLL